MSHDSNRQLAAKVIAGLQSAQHLNPDVLQRGQDFFKCMPDGKEVRLCRSKEGVKVAVGCVCGEHVRWCTLNSLRKDWDLLCQFCHYDEPQWRQAKKRKVAESEIAAMSALRHVHLDKQDAFEVCLPFWHGRVDFYDVVSQTVIQADGKSHRVVTHKKQPWRQVKLDVKCCMDAWKKGIRLLRLYHSPGVQHSTWGQAILAATALTYPRFVMLSDEYSTITVDVDGNCTCIAWLAEQLQGAKYIFDDASKCHLFSP